MAGLVVSASHKKRDGVVSLSADNKVLVWVPSLTGTVPTISIPIPTITNLQATPPTSAKAMIKVFAQLDTTAPVEQYVFTFNSPTSTREEASQLKEALTTAIQLSKTQEPPKQDLGTSNGSGKGARKDWTNDDLCDDMALQQAVLSQSPELQKCFHETVIEGKVTANQFWSTRINLLRAHAIEKSQLRGSYNVLASIKPKSEDSVLRVSLTRDQIHAIFEQHPIVKRIYDEVVPKLREDEFWRRFFLSRLYKRLKGERTVAMDGYDDVFDPYLTADDMTQVKTNELGYHIPQIINLGANEENHSQKQGNRPDLTMRPNNIENVPIIRTLNNLSTKILDTVKPIDSIYDSVSDGADVSKIIRLADLDGDKLESHILLGVRDQKRFFDLNRQSATSQISGSLVNSEAALSCLTQKGKASSVVTEPADDDRKESRESSGTDLQAPKFLRIASHQVSTALFTRRIQIPELHPEKSGLSSIMLPEEVLIQLRLTHATSAEFLRHFWDSFLSGDPKRAGDARAMAESLKRSLQRIEQISVSAQDTQSNLEYQIKAEKGTEEEKDAKKRRKKRSENSNLTPSELVSRIMSPQTKAIKAAIARYQQALEFDDHQEW